MKNCYNVKIIVIEDGFNNQIIYSIFTIQTITLGDGK